MKGNECNPPTRAGVTWKYLTQDPNDVGQSKIQNPNSPVWGRRKKKKQRLNRSKNQNPKSKIQGPKSKIQDRKSKIQDPKSKHQTPKSKSKLGWGRRRWLCSKRCCMASPAARNWPSRRPSLQPKGSRLDPPQARSKLGTDFRRKVLLETEPRFPAPSWKPGLNFQRNDGEAGTAHHPLSEFNPSNAGTKTKQRIACRSLLLPFPLKAKWNCRCLCFLGVLDYVEDCGSLLNNNKACESIVQYIQYLLRVQCFSGSAADRR